MRLDSLSYDDRGIEQNQALLVTDAALDAGHFSPTDQASLRGSIEKSLEQGGWGPNSDRGHQRLGRRPVGSILDARRSSARWRWRSTARAHPSQGRASDKRGGKTANADKTIAIDGGTAAALRRWRAQQDEIRALRGPDYEGGDLVFTTEFGRPLHPQNLVDLIERYAAEAGIPRITFHDLRHTYATAALEGGVAMKVVSERIGHSNVSFTMQTYAHVRADADHQAARQAAEFLLGDG